MNSDVFNYYQVLDKPFFAPPAAVFGPVWTVLYFCIAISFGYVFVQVLTKKWPISTLTPFVINLISNAAFTPLQFWMRSNILASIDIIVVLVTIIWMIRVSLHRNRIVAYAQIPYLLWVAFATVLQLTITVMNW